MSDGEVRSDYDANKEQYIKVAGGTQVKGTKFTDKAAADSFYDDVTKNVNEFETLAKANDKGEFQDFGLVSEDPRTLIHSTVPAAVREAALAVKKDPSVEKVTEGDQFWVIHVSDKKETQHFAFDEIKEQLQTKVRSKKFADELESRLKALRDEFTIDINNTYFTPTQKVVRLPIDQLPIRKIQQEEKKEQAQV